MRGSNVQLGMSRANKSKAERVKSVEKEEKEERGLRTTGGRRRDAREARQGPAGASKRGERMRASTALGQSQPSHQVRPRGANPPHSISPMQPDSLIRTPRREGGSLQSEMMRRAQLRGLAGLTTTTLPGHRSKGLDPLPGRGGVTGVRTRRENWGEMARGAGRNREGEVANGEGDGGGVRCASRTRRVCWATNSRSDDGS